MDKQSIKILSVALNNIKLDELFQVDKTGNSNDTNDKRSTGANQEKGVGLVQPFISINGYNISNYLSYFSLDLSGFLPTVYFKFTAEDSTFISLNYPKDGDIASVYIRSPEGYYKPFRMDFNILNVISNVSSWNDPSGSDPEGKGNNLKFIIVGECRISGLYTNRIKAFNKSTSYQTLLEVSQDLDLGFSSNDTELADTMTWICPSHSYYDFIREVTTRSYKDDEYSFFDCWIDSYYNLNYINLGSQFAFDGNLEDSVLIIPGYTGKGVALDSNIHGVEEQKPEEHQLVLTNLRGSASIPFFINGYTLTSRAGSNTNDAGYITKVCMYDENLEIDPTQKYISYDIESQTPTNIEDGDVLQKGRGFDNEYKKEIRKEWYGSVNVTEDDGADGGVHKNYIHASVQNSINLSDVTKTTLEVELNSYFPGIYRGQVIPVSIYVSEVGNRQEYTGATENGVLNESKEPGLDNFLSGNYVVMGIEVYWSETTSGIKEKLILSKRVWKVNKGGKFPKVYPYVIK